MPTARGLMSLVQHLMQIYSRTTHVDAQILVKGSLAQILGAVITHMDQDNGLGVTQVVINPGFHPYTRRTYSHLSPYSANRATLFPQ